MKISNGAEHIMGLFFHIMLNIWLKVDDSEEAQASF